MPAVRLGSAKEEDRAKRVVKGTWIEVLARLGYLVRGILYIVVGVIAIQVALGAGGETQGKEGALAAIERQPFGAVLLLLVLVGLLGYSLWGVVRAIFDPLRKGKSPKGLVERGGYIVSAIAYGSLIFPTVRLLLGHGTDESSSAEKGTAVLLAQPLGSWLVIAVGAVATIGGVGQLFTAFTGRFEKDFKRGEMTREEFVIASRFGRVGYLARGVVFIMAGVFLVRAALLFNPQEAMGLDETLSVLAQQSYGLVLMGLTALGLVSFGIYSILCTRWIQVVKSKDREQH